MSKKLLTLSQDEQSILDEAGKVVYVARTGGNGEIYYDKPEITKGSICIGWDTIEVCVRWGKDQDGNKVCVSLSQKKICVEWKS